jgi:TRAP-type C4-dicarboxylate transport system permease small subunit
MAVDNLQPLAYAVASVMFAIGTISFFLRFYCRAIVKNAFGWDDVLSVFLLVCSNYQPLS